MGLKVIGTSPFIGMLNKAVLNDALEDAVLRGMAKQSLEYVDDNFENGVDPYGRKHTPLKYRQGTPLYFSGQHLKNTFNATQPVGGVIEFGTKTHWAGVHQDGATIVPKNKKFLRFFVTSRSEPIFAKSVTIPRRQMLPDKVKGLPNKWRAGLPEAATEAIAGIIKP